MEMNYELNAQLQKKKAKVRKAIVDMGVLKREGINDFDHYTYFSEMQYKSLFNPIFSREGLEIKVSEKDHEMYDGPGKQPEGRLVTLQIDLIDIDTGYFESSYISGDGLDKGDKGLYKAYTGAVKYYLATTFLVPTGDDAEKTKETTETETVSENEKETDSSNEANNHVKRVRRKKQRTGENEPTTRSLMDDLPFD